MKKIMNRAVFFVGLFTIYYLLFAISAFAVTKPDPNADINSLSYVFYLYYDHGQLFADRDYEIKYDVVSEVFTAETVDESSAFKGVIVNFKSDTVRAFFFDPKKGDPNFVAGKVAVRGPYASDGSRAQFYDAQGNQLVTVFINSAALCNDDGFCDSTGGENETNCAADCKKPRGTPIPAASVEPALGFFGGSDDLTTILIYAVGGTGVVVGAWFGWRWWKKKKEGSFLPPPPPSSPPVSPPPPPPSSFPMPPAY